ncbi:glycosyltransferase family protein [Candidatus Woesearchaeota archaeon]|nr:glycosyltransferase family protein [Candidatus Woesearchaeota archaeon]
MIGAIVQARMNSTRLPGKVLMDVEGRPLLYRLIMRLKQCKLLDKIVVATSVEKDDLPIVSFCRENNIPYFTGSKDDVLDRFYQTAKQFNIDVVVRITGDCPLIDPEVTDKVIQYYADNQETFDYISNGRPPTYPDGLDTEVFSFQTLEKLWKTATKKYHKEHVTALVSEDASFQIGNVENDKDLSHLRWIVDYKEDLEFVREVYRRLYSSGKVFGKNEILQLLEQEPQLQQINGKFVRNDGFAKSLKEEGVDPALHADAFKMGNKKMNF